MKTRILATVLLLAMVLGLFGCAGGASSAPIDNADDVPSGFLPAHESSLLSGGDEKETADMLNIAATDEAGDAIFQIVYNIEALRVEEQCQALAADIYDVTGVSVPVVHSSKPQKKYELMVGEVKRSETLDVIDGFELEDGDFVICTVGTRILIYAESDQAVISGVIFFMEQVAYRSPLQGMYGVDPDYSFTYHPNEVPPVMLTDSADDERFVEFRLENGPLMYTYTRLSYTGNEGWRIQTKYREDDEYRATGASQILAYSLGEHVLGTEDERFYTEPITTSQTGDTLTVTSPDGSRVEINLKEFRMEFFTKSGKLASTVTNIMHNAGNSSVTGLLEGGEAVFGTGQRFNSVNQRGRQIEMFIKDIWNRDWACYLAIPLLCMSRGSGVLINNYEHMVIDLDSKNRDPSKEGVWTATVTGAPLDCYVFTTERLPEVIYGYSALSGFSDMPEEWSYGVLVNSYGPDFAARWTDEIKQSDEGLGEGVYEFIANMETYDLPWTGVIVEGWAGYNSAKNHVALKELCDYVHSLGKKLMVYFRIGHASGDMQGYNQSYLLTQTTANGKTTHRLPDTTGDTNNPDVGSGSGRTHVYVDITDPAATAWYFGYYWDYLSKEVGVDGCKIDFCETLPENYHLNYFDESIPTAGSHHWYPTAFANKFWDMISSKPDSGLCFTRGGGIGAQRSPIMWAGDQVRFWDGINWQLRAVLSSGLSGVPFMSYDMSGYQYGTNALYRRVEYESQVFLRGVQYSAFVPCVQSMGKVKRAYQFAKEFPLLDADGNEVKDADGNTVMKDYTYVTDIYRAYTKLHEHLTPYITELATEATETGMPPVRHLVLNWQEDPTVYNIEDQYMFGDAFMIAPMMSEGTARRVYLPQGIWEDLNTGTVYDHSDGGDWIDVTASIAELPTFYNRNSESETAFELLNGIRELYDYAKGLVPEV